jgi:hypothetical protein
MTQLTQVPFADIGFVNNPEPRCPCVLLLDASGFNCRRHLFELDPQRRKMSSCCVRP